MSSPLPGHLFVIDGDLTRLRCDAVLIPTDQSLHLTSVWTSLIGFSGHVTDASAPHGWRSTVRSFRYRTPPDSPEIWLGNIGWQRADEGWYASGLVDFVERATAAIESPVDRPLRLAVNVAGAGAGGSAHDKGQLFRSIIPALTDAADRLGVDIVLVCWGVQQYAAAQRVRQRSSSALTSSNDPLTTVAAALAEHARKSELVLFLGAGVSMVAVLPSWQELLDQLLAKSGTSTIDTKRVRELDVRDQAHLISQRSGSVTEYREAFRSLIDTPFCALAHGLLASLHAREAVTTNYDKLYERAVSTDQRTCAVLPYEPVLDQDRWLLKLHGCVDHIDDIVLTRSDYLGLPARSGALFGVLQALLMTRHMLFVGYSLTDDTFHKVMHEVRHARGNAPGKVGTALVLFDDPLLAELWGDDLNIVAVAPRPSGEPSAADIADASRRLDLLLDRICLLSADVSSFLLDPTYRSMLDEEEQALADVFTSASSVVNNSTGPIADLIRPQLERLGARRVLG